MELLLLHPGLPSCADCCQWLYDEHWQPVLRAGQMQKRPHESQTPCWQCPKIPKGAKPEPASAIELSPRNWKALQYHMEVKAGVMLADDAIARRNGALICWTEESVRRGQAGATVTAVLAAAGVKRKG